MRNTLYKVLEIQINIQRNLYACGGTGLHAATIAGVAIELWIAGLSAGVSSLQRRRKICKEGGAAVNITRKYARSKGTWEESNGLKWIGIQRIALRIQNPDPAVANNLFSNKNSQRENLNYMKKKI